MIIPLVTRQTTLASDIAMVVASISFRNLQKISLAQRLRSCPMLRQSKAKPKSPAVAIKL